jgi:hypothetical protein
VKPAATREDLAELELEAGDRLGGDGDAELLQGMDED